MFQLGGSLVRSLPDNDRLLPAWRKLRLTVQRRPSSTSRVWCTATCPTSCRVSAASRSTGRMAKRKTSAWRIPSDRDEPLFTGGGILPDPPVAVFAALKAWPKQCAHLDPLT